MTLEPEILSGTAGNKSFSLAIPGLQLAVDSTSLGTFKECPRKYYYSIVRGLRPRTESVHLTFGILIHGARERYDHWLAGGAGHETALRAVVKWCLTSTWTNGRPWTPDSREKNRLTLVRTMVWYLDDIAKDDPIQTVQLASGKPAAELSFSFPAGTESLSSSEPFLLCGHLDRIGLFNSEAYIVDIKTTTHSIDAGWFSKFSPDNQFSMYCLAGRVVYQTPVAGLVVDGIQVGATFSRHQRGLVSRSEGQSSEWLGATQWWLRSMESCAVAQDWPQNDKSCGLYGGCGFRGVCGKPPHAREPWLRGEFTTRQWDPLTRRGDI